MLKSCNSKWNSSLKMLIVCIDYDFKKLVCLCFFFSRRTAHRSNNMRSSAKNATIMNFLKRTSRSDHCCVSWELLFLSCFVSKRSIWRRWRYSVHTYVLYFKIPHDTISLVNSQKIILTSQLVKSELLYQLQKKKNVHK